MLPPSASDCRTGASPICRGGALSSSSGKRLLLLWSLLLLLLPPPLLLLAPPRFVLWFVLLAPALGELLFEAGRTV